MFNPDNGAIKRTLVGVVYHGTSEDMGPKWVFLLPRDCDFYWSALLVNLESVKFFSIQLSKIYPEEETVAKRFQRLFSDHSSFQTGQNKCSAGGEFQFR